MASTTSSSLLGGIRVLGSASQGLGFGVGCLGFRASGAYGLGQGGFVVEYCRLFF